MKIVFDSIKELIQEVNINFKVDSEEDAGVYLNGMDNSNMVLVGLMMDKTEIMKSGVYKCSQPGVAGIDVSKFYKILKTVTDQDTLILRMDPSTPHMLILRSENVDRRKYGQFEIKLLDLDEEELEMPPETFDSIITLDSAEFQKMCRDLTCLETDRVRIGSSGTQFFMSASGDPGKGTFRIGEKKGTSIENVSPSEFKSNVYPLKILTCITKCTKLTPTVRILLKEDYPIIIEYHVPTLGLLRFHLSNIHKSDLKEEHSELNEEDIREEEEEHLPPPPVIGKKRSMSSSTKQRKKQRLEHPPPSLPIPNIQALNQGERRSVIPPPSFCRSSN